MLQLVYVSLCLNAISVCLGAGQTVSVDYDPSIPQIAFASEKIQHALDSKGYTYVPKEGQHQISIAIRADGRKPESF